jgi:hypothetical protein
VTSSWKTSAFRKRILSTRSNSILHRKVGLGVFLISPYQILLKLIMIFVFHFSDSFRETSGSFATGISEAFRQSVDSSEVDEVQQRPDRSRIFAAGILSSLGRLFRQVIFLHLPILVRPPAGGDWQTCHLVKGSVEISKLGICPSLRH